MPNIINQSPIFYNITGGQNANLQWQLVCNTLNGASATYWVYLNGTQEQTGTFTNNQIITYTVPNNLATLNLPYYYNYTIVVYMAIQPLIIINQCMSFKCSIQLLFHLPMAHPIHIIMEDLQSSGGLLVIPIF